MERKKEMVVYVKLDEYNEIKEIVSLIRAKLKQARFLLGNISELKKKEDAELDGLSSELNQVGERVDAVDRILAEPGM